MFVTESLMLIPYTIVLNTCAIYIPYIPIFIKECTDILLPSITRLVNCSLSEGVVPDWFKKHIVTPLIKKSSLPLNEL